MFFRTIEPQGDVFDAMRHWLALAFLVLIGLGVIAAQILLGVGAVASSLGFLDYATGYLQLLFLPLAGLHIGYWGPLVGALLLAAGLHYMFYLSVLTMLARRHALSLANILVGTTVLAALLALLPVITGYGTTTPKYRLPLLEDYAQSFLLYAIALALGGVLEWVCLRTAPPEAAA